MRIGDTAAAAALGMVLHNHSVDVVSRFNLCVQGPNIYIHISTTMFKICEMVHRLHSPLCLVRVLTGTIFYIGVVIDCDYLAVHLHLVSVLNLVGFTGNHSLHFDRF
jgi:hypothetical protein